MLIFSYSAFFFKLQTNTCKQELRREAPESPCFSGRVRRRGASFPVEGGRTALFIQTWGFHGGFLLS